MGPVATQNVELSLSQRLGLSTEEIAEFCRRWQISEFALFGSILRDDFRPDSDIDVLVSFASSAYYTLFDLIRMEDELRGMSGRNVDLVERETIAESENYIRRRHILNSAKTVYVAG